MSTHPWREPLSESDASHHRRTARQLPVTDSDLWGRFKLGDEQAIIDLYDRYSQLVYSVAYHVLHDPGTSEDVLQEVFLQLWRVPEAFEPSKGSLAAWLTVVSRRRAIDRLRQRKTEIDVEDLVTPVMPTQLSDATLHQITNRVSALLQEMPEKMRVTFDLAYMQGLSHREISERLGDPLGTTKSRIRQALDFIRRKLDCNRDDENGNGHVR